MRKACRTIALSVRKRLRSPSPRADQVRRAEQAKKIRTRRANWDANHCWAA